MIEEKDLVNGRAMTYRGERVTYVGRSITGGFVIERDPRTAKDKPRFENVWPFQLTLQESKN